jgi:hypothetical protein
MRAREDLDDRGDAVLLDADDDPGESVARRLGHDRAIGGRLASLADQPGDLAHRDEALAAVRTRDRQPAGLGPAPDRVHGDTQHLGRSPNPNMVTRLVHT